MVRKLLLGFTTAALGAASLIAPTVASAQYAGGYGYERYDRAYDHAYQDGWNRGPRYYDSRAYAYQPRRCHSGTTGTILGAVAGGLLGRAIDDRGDHALGTILGAGGGALAGRAVDRSGNPGWCR